MKIVKVITLATWLLVALRALSILIEGLRAPEWDSYEDQV